MTGIAFGSTISGSVSARSLIPDYMKDGDYVIKITIDPNAKYNESISFTSITGSTYLSIGTEENNLTQLVPEYNVNTSSNQNEVYDKYIKINTNDTIYIESKSPLLGGYYDTATGDLNINGGWGSMTTIEGYDSNPPTETSVLIKYIVYVYTEYDPSLDTSSVTIDLDLTK